MEHRATSQFWQHYQALQRNIRSSADKQFSLLKENPQRRSLQFKKIGDRHGEEVYSARVTLSHRALAFKRPYGFVVLDRRPRSLRTPHRLEYVRARVLLWLQDNSKILNAAGD